MKKLIALMLTFLLVLCIVACDSGNAGDSEETSGNTEESGGNDETTGETNGSDEDGETTAGDDVTTSGDGGSVKEPVLQDAVTVDETVYLAVDGAAYRSAPESLDDNVKGSLRWNDSVHRVLYNSEWSVIEINGTKYYLPTECLSETEMEGASDFTSVNDTVLSVGTDIVLRTAPIVSDLTEQLYLDEGVSLRRVRYSGSWSVVVYENVEYYVEAEYHSGSQGSSAEDLSFSDYSGTLTVTSTSAKLYGIPSNDDDAAEIVGTVVQGDTLTAVSVSSDGQWYGVSYLDPATGLTSQVYIKASSVSSEA